MGLLEDLEKHKESIDELRRRVEGLVTPKLSSDNSLYFRFLKARNFNLNDAEVMLKNHIKWRKLHRIDTILAENQIPEVINYFTIITFGVDKDGATIGYSDFGNLDIKGLLKSMKKSDILRQATFFFEYEVQKMEERNLERTNPTHQWSFIINFENFSIFSATHKDALDFFVSLAKLYEANYPERLKNAYFINASYLFTIGWAVVKTVVTKETSEKIKIFGADKWKEEILKTVDADVLPAFLGGNRTDPDGNPMCNTFIPHGGKIPEEYYMRNLARDRICKDPDAKRLSVGRRSKAELVFEVAEEGCRIEWSFDIAEDDIRFCVLHKQRSDLPAEELLPSERVETNYATEEGMLKCEKQGVYILRFDNTYSWWKSKEIYYKASVVSSSL